MKNFKTVLSEIFDLETKKEENIKTFKEVDHETYVSRTYKSKIENDEIETRIDHFPNSNRSDIKFMVNGAVSIGGRRPTKDTLKIYGTVLKHIKHHIDTAPTDVKIITYSYDDSPEGEKKNKLYERLGKRFNIAVSGRRSESR